MANPFDEIILEGFICPKCMLTFGTPDLLSQHFKVEHQNIIIPENGECFPLNKSGLKTQSDASNSFAFYNRKNEVQPLGMCHSLTSKFIELRKNHVNCSSLETNCLLIRLEKLIDVSETNESDRKAFEQAVVPWIDAKVDLCPSCGKPFGLGAEMTFPNEEDEYLDSSESNTSIYRFWPSKSNVARLTNAILDYNPVYRRRHHCRLCGYILCADCSYFISIHNARNLLNALNGQDSDIFQVSLNAADPNSQPKYSLESVVSFRKRNTSSFKSGYELRICSICVNILKRKINSMKALSVDTPIIQMHIEFKELMKKVCEWLPSYTIIAESLNSGEQKYTLESARSMHSDLLQALQKIETLGRQFAEYGEPDSELYVNRVVARLALAVYRRARHFVQNYLPPLQTLPTLKQYVNLTSQRKDELAVRWSEEDKALAELMELVSGKQNFAKMDPSTNPTTKRWQRFFQLPISTSNTYDKRQGKKTTIEYLDSIANKMDLVAGQLMTARQEGQLQIAEELAQELHQLEQEFQKTSSSLNDTESPTL
ncbi:Rabenosyn-5 [Schistosoma japonicum]|nr:Rabenosyn-5 [Schistosoma japonicum]